MKSKLFHGNLSTRKGEVPFSCLCKHKANIHLLQSQTSFERKFGRRIILPYCKKRKVNYYIRTVFLSTNNKSVMLQIFTLQGKTKVSYYILLRKKQVSYYITFFQTLLRPFSCDFCYSVEESFYLTARKGK